MPNQINVNNPPRDTERSRELQTWMARVAQVCQAITEYGTTAQRPTTGLWIGRPYFDTTLDKSVHWNGTTWV